ncbi:MAG: hypothetical protein Q4D33_06510 [Prevotellaceae bacterium]|nr:hypothetical protein [Prevotellaceae bacterium]
MIKCVSGFDKNRNKPLVLMSSQSACCYERFKILVCKHPDILNHSHQRGELTTRHNYKAINRK